MHLREMQDEEVRLAAVAVLTHFIHLGEPNGGDGNDPNKRGTEMHFMKHLR